MRSIAGGRRPLAELRFELRLRRGAFRLDMAAEIPAEGVTAIMGPSGSGKSTLLSALAGLERDVEGRARLDDAVWQEGPLRLPPRDRRIGLVFQDARLFGHMSVAENVSYGAKRRGVSDGIVAGIVDALSLGPLMARRPATLSGGERRRVALARAMASAPDILFMDEPMAGLDDAAKEHLLPFIARGVAESGVPVIYVTHAQAEVTMLADRVLRVAEGRVLGWGPPPPHLAVTVTGADLPGLLEVELGPLRFVLPGQGRVGDARRIAIPANGVLLSRQHPGETAALGVMQAKVAQVLPAGGAPDCIVEVAGQRLRIPAMLGSELAGRPPREGEVMWLTLLTAHLR